MDENKKTRVSLIVSHVNIMGPFHLEKSTMHFHHHPTSINTSNISKKNIHRLDSNVLIEVTRRGKKK